jgi:hypothetical protein
MCSRLCQSLSFRLGPVLSSGFETPDILFSSSSLHGSSISVQKLSCLLNFNFVSLHHYSIVCLGQSIRPCFRVIYRLGLSAWIIMFWMNSSHINKACCASYASFGIYIKFVQLSFYLFISVHGWTTHLHIFLMHRIPGYVVLWPPPHIFYGTSQPRVLSVPARLLVLSLYS